MAMAVLVPVAVLALVLVLVLALVLVRKRGLALVLMPVSAPGLGMVLPSVRLRWWSRCLVWMRVFLSPQFHKFLNWMLGAGLCL